MESTGYRRIISFSITPEVFEILETRRGRMNRSRFLNNIIKQLEDQTVKDGK